MEQKALTKPKTLSLVNFSPKKEELELMIKKSKDLTIAGVEDKKGYDLVRAARMKFVKTRVQIGKDGKALRDEALVFNKKVIAREKELIAMIGPVEDELFHKERIINEEKEKLKNKEALPKRIERLKGIDAVVDNDFLLSMDDKKFNSFFIAKKDYYLAEKERKIKKEQEKIEAEKKKLEENKRLEEAKKEAERQAKEDAIKEAELAKLKAEEDKRKAVEEEKRKAAEAIEAEKRRAEEERQKAEEEKLRLEREKKQAIEDEKLKAKQEKEKIIAEQKEKERQRLEKERVEEERLVERKRRRKKEAEKRAKKQEYKNFLKKHGYTEEKEKDFYIIQDGNLTILYKKVGEINI